MNQIATNLVRLTRRPGFLLLGAATVPVVVFVLLALLVGLQAATGGGWALFAVALLLAVPVALLAIRRERLRRTTDGFPGAGAVVAGGVVDHPAIPATDPLTGAVGAEAGTWAEAVAETQIRTARWLPRVEATQRALVRAAGGVVNAPYLRDDLRVTLLAVVGTLLAIPLATLGVFLAAFVLLLG